jgi:fibronectin-binding autotransporter adhesin
MKSFRSAITSVVLEGIVKAHFIALCAGLSLVSIAGPSWAAQQSWTGAISSDWNNASNWTNNQFPSGSGNSTIINTTPANIATLTANSAFQPGWDVIVANGGSFNARADQRAGLLMSGTGNYLIIGNGGTSVGVYNLADTSGAGGAYTDFAMGSGSFTAGNISTTSGRLLLGNGGTSRGTFSMNTSGVMNTQDNSIGILAGTNGGSGVVNLDNGTINVNDGGQSWFGDNSATSSGTLNMSGGVFNASGDMYFGHNAGSKGVFNLTGGTVNVTGGKWMYFGYNNASSGGTLNMSGGVLNDTAGDLMFGYPNSSGAIGGTGVMNLSGGTINAAYVRFGNSFASTSVGVGSGTIGVGAVLNSNTWIDLALGGNGATGVAGGTLAVNGTLNVNTVGSGNLTVGSYDSVKGRLDVNAGATVRVENNGLLEMGVMAGNTDTSVVNQNGGAVIFYSDSGVTVGGAGYLNMENAGAGNYTYNLNGGTLQVLKIGSVANGGTRNFYFNGGTLKATAGTTAFVSNLSNAYVSSGGAIIDDSGYAVTIPQALVLNPSSTGGGLTKNGAGTTILTGVCTYTGTTNVAAGTLQLNTASGASGELASASIIVNPGTALALNVTDVLGYTVGRNALIISGGTVSNITAAGRITLANTINMTGGVLTGSGTGDGNGSYSVYLGAGFAATSDAFGNPAIVNAASIGLEENPLNFNVTRGSLNPASDMTVSSSIIPFTVNGGISKTGNGILLLSGSSTYGGGTTVSAGTLQMGSAAALGAATGNLAVNGGLLDLNNFGLTVGQLSGTGGLTTSNAVGSPILTVNNTAATTFAGAIVNGASGTPGLTLGSGTLSLNGANSYTGPTVVSGGALLQVGNAATLGGGSGTPLTLGSGTAAGTLVLGDANGPAGTATVASLNAGGSSASSAVVGGNAAVSTLTVNYNGVAANAFLGVLGGSGPNQNNLALTKTGTGTLTLGGTHTYTGNTNVNGGVLNVTGALPNTAVAVNSGGALAGFGDNMTTGIVGGSVVVNGGGGLTLSAASSASSLTLNSGLTLGNAGAYNASNYATLNYTLGGSGIEPVNLGPAGSPSGILTLNSGGAYVNVAGTPILGTYTLMNFASQAGGNQFSLSSTAANVTTKAFGRNTYTLLDGGNSLQVQITGVPVPGVAYFDGAVSSVWNDLSNPSLVNWSTNKAGTTDANNTPGLTSDVILTANNRTGAVVTTLGGATTINSLNVNSTAASNTINADGSTLTIRGLADANTDTGGGYTGNPAGNGIAIAAGAGAVTINTPVNLGGSQTWTNGSGSAFLVAGNVAGTALLNASQTLTLANAAAGGTTIGGVISDGLANGTLAVAVNNTGGGITILSASNTYSGGTTLTAGSLTLGNASGLGTGGLTVNGGRLDLAGYSYTFPTLNGAGGTITNNGSALILTAPAGAYAGSINDGAAAITVVKTSGGTLALTGASNYSGGTTLSGGLLQISNSASLGASSGALTFNGGSLQLLADVATTRNYVVNANQNAIIDSNAHTLTLNGSITAATSAANAGLNKIGSGALVLAGNNTLSGAMTVNAGVLNLTGGLTSGATAVNLLATSTSNAVLQTSGTLSQYRMYVGNASGAAAAIYQNGGSVTTTFVGGDSTGLGQTLGSYGYYNLSGGGALTTQELQVGTWGPANNGGSGLFEMSSGTLSNLGWLIMTRSQGALGQSGVFNMSGGLINFAGGGFVTNWGSNQSATINVSGGTIATTNNLGINLNDSGNAANTGILNLNGGLVQVANVTGTYGLVNFNGGTLKASGANANFITVGSAYLYGGGAVIDDGGYAVTVNQALLAPGGNGVTTGGLTVSGSGYIAPPIVTVSDPSGVGATAIASIDANGNLTGITITNPGSNYTSPSFTVSGGGGTGSISGADILAANTSGGLTKTGSGIVTLTAASTYGGTTLVNQGALLAVNTSVIPNYLSAGTLSVAPAAAFAVQGGGAGEWLSADIDALLATPAFAPSSALGISVTGANTFTYSNDVGTNQVNKGFLKLGTGLLVLDGANTYTGATIVSAGTLQFGSGGATPLPATPAYLNNATLAFNSALNMNVTAPIAGSGNLAQLGGNVLRLSSTGNSYAGATNVTGGTLQLGADQALPSTTVATFNGGAMDLNGHTNTIAQLIVNNSSIVQANGSLTTASGGDGIVQIGGVVGSSGSYTMTGGALTSAAGVFDVGWYGNGTFTQSGGTVTTTANYFVVGRQTGSTGNYAISGGVLAQNSGAAIIVAQQGTATLTVSGSGLVSAAGGGIFVGSFAGGAGNGTLNLSGGTVQTTQLLGLAGGVSTVNFNGGALQAGPGAASAFLNGFNNAVVQAGGAVIDTGSNSITVGQPLSHDATLGAALDGGLTKLGAGMLTLSASNGYSGPTLISAGTLQLSTANLASGVSPVALYNFAQTGTGSTAIVNLGTGGTAMNGGLQGSASIVSGGRNGQNALSLPGLGGSRVLISSGIINMSSAQNWTVDGWFETSGTGATLFYKGSGGWTTGNDTFYLTNGNATAGGTKVGAVRYAGGWINDTTTAVNNGAWHFFAISDAAGTKSVYVDGLLASSGAGFLNTDAGNQVWIGNTADPGDGTAPFNGLMSSLAYYQNTLSASDIQALYYGSNVLPTTTALQIQSGAVLDLNGVNQTVASLSDVAGAGGAVTTSAVGNVVLTVSPTGGSTTFSGSIGNGSGTLSLVKSGAGTQVLSGSNSYSGGTTIGTFNPGAAGGVLLITNGQALGVGNVYVTAGDPGSDQLGAQLQLAGGITVNNPTIYTSGQGYLADTGVIRSLSGSNTINSAISLGAGAGGTSIGADAGILTLTGSITANTTARTLEFTGAGTILVTGNISDGATVGLPVTLTGPGTLILAGSDTYSGGTFVNGGTLIVESPTSLLDGSSLIVGQGASSLFAPAVAGPAAAVSGASAVPEPGTIALLLAALCSATACRRFSKSQSKII